MKQQEHTSGYNIISWVLLIVSIWGVFCSGHPSIFIGALLFLTLLELMVQAIRRKLSWQRAAARV